MKLFPTMFAATPQKKAVPKPTPRPGGPKGSGQTGAPKKDSVPMPVGSHKKGREEDPAVDPNEKFQTCFA